MMTIQTMIDDSDSSKMNMWVDYIDRDTYVCIYDSYPVN